MTRIPQPHTARAHAQLAPSSAHRWINCPGSIKASEGVEEKSSTYAAEGTAAHEFASLVLSEGVNPGDHLGHFIDIDDVEHRLKHSAVPNKRNVWPITEEMIEAVSVYADHVHSLIEGGRSIGLLDVEQRLDMRHIHPAIFGTGDAVVYDIEGEHLHVCDFKYGKGHIVEVKNNPQLGLYGAGAARRYHNHRLSKITLYIIQPRTQGNPIKSWETDLLELLDFEGDIAKAAARTDEPNAPLVAGDWCSEAFCPIRATCAVRRDKTMADAQAEFDEVGEMSLPAIAALTDVQRGTILRQADQIFAFVKSVQEAEHANALAGNPPVGWKLVAKRANRKWSNEEEAVIALKLAGVEEYQMFSEPKFKSPAQVETALGKKEFAKVLSGAEAGDKLVVKQSSGVNLVPLEDPRPAVAADALAEFSAIETE